MRLAASILATALCITLPLAAVASSNHTGGAGGQSSGGGSRSSSTGAHAAPAARSAPRSAPVAPRPRSAPVAPGPRSAPIGGETRRLPGNRPSNGGHPVPNPNTYQLADWSAGQVWVGYDGYWGNGFWGPLAYGLSAASYVVATGSPGASLLQAYDLRQTPCGPPDLVEIYGPDGSEICAYPNALVAPGAYSVDPDTLTLYSEPPQI